MNLSIKDVDGKVLIVSQFTLAGNYISGNRPSFINAEDPTEAENARKNNQCIFKFSGNKIWSIWSNDGSRVKKMTYHICITSQKWSVNKLAVFKLAVNLVFFSNFLSR